MVHTMVDFFSGGHFNVLHDCNYKKIWPLKILKLYDRQCHYVINVLNKFCQNYLPPALLIMLQMCLPSKLAVFAKC